MRKKLTVMLVIALIVCLCISTTAAGVLFVLRDRDGKVGSNILTEIVNTDSSITEPYINGSTLIFKNRLEEVNLETVIPQLDAFKSYNKNVVGYSLDVDDVYLAINIPAKRENLFVKVNMKNGKVEWVNQEYNFDCFYTNVIASGFSIAYERACFSRTGDVLHLDPATGVDKQIPASYPR